MEVSELFEDDKHHIWGVCRTSAGLFRGKYSIQEL